jgi:hypothetical protein
MNAVHRVIAADLNLAISPPEKSPLAAVVDKNIDPTMMNGRGRSARGHQTRPRHPHRS